MCPFHFRELILAFSPSAPQSIHPRLLNALPPLVEGRGSETLPFSSMHLTRQLGTKSDGLRNAIRGRETERQRQRETPKYKRRQGERESEKERERRERERDRERETETERENTRSQGDSDTHRTAGDRKKCLLSSERKNSIKIGDMTD